MDSPSENKEILDRIKAKLNPKLSKPTPKAPTVPPQIHEALSYISENISNNKKLTSESALKFTDRNDPESFREKSRLVNFREGKDSEIIFCVILSEYGMELIKTTPIHYGHQLRIATGNIWTELNLFYGQKKGYTIVKTTKTGSNEELCELAAQVIYELILKIETHS